MAAQSSPWSPGAWPAHQIRPPSAQTDSDDDSVPRLLLRLPMGLQPKDLSRGEGRDPFLPSAPAPCSLPGADFAGVTKFLVAALVHRRPKKRMNGSDHQHDPPSGG